ncbi:MAG: hypothetical protein KIG47_07425, partial [Prevotellamassilia sp.]|nr:hypothetical protein [Prevotellamassilia sp.]
MKLQLFISSILLSSLPLSAQSALDAVTDSVLAYDTTLKALRAEVTAANAATRADLSPDDTNVELG